MNNQKVYPARFVFVRLILASAFVITAIGYAVKLLTDGHPWGAFFLLAVMFGALAGIYPDNVTFEDSDKKV